MKTKIVVSGAKGRMGASVLECARNDPEIEIVGAFDREGGPAHYMAGEEQRPIEILSPQDPMTKPIVSIKESAIVVDFSHHAATPVIVKQAVMKKCPMVIGTTGFIYSERQAIVGASKAIPIVLAPNMSVGVNLLYALTDVVVSILRQGFDVEIIEKHHRQKKDSPSGTAGRLAEIIAKARGLQAESVIKHGRYGDLNTRGENEIGIHSIRGGDFIGEHTVLFAGDGESLELSHRATSRYIFARGALVAAKWIASADPGLYDMVDVLGLRIKHQP